MSWGTLLSNEHFVWIVLRGGNERAKTKASLCMKSEEPLLAREAAHLLTTSATHTDTITHGYSQCNNTLTAHWCVLSIRA